jgi:hypothetical protein
VDVPDDDGAFLHERTKSRRHCAQGRDIWSGEIPTGNLW